jgi:hypothetical protein
MRRGPSTRGTARSSGWTKLRYSRRTTLTASMELKLVFYLVHDVDAKEEKRPQMVDFKDSLVAVWINTSVPLLLKSPLAILLPSQRDSRMASNKDFDIA